MVAVCGHERFRGARLQEGWTPSRVTDGCSGPKYLLGIVPQIALLMGPCLGGQAYHPVMQDFLIQTKGAGFMASLARLLLKRKRGGNQPGGTFRLQSHAVKSGQTHVVAEDDADCLDKCKELLALLPSSNRENHLAS